MRGTRKRMSSGEGNRELGRRRPSYWPHGSQQIAGAIAVDLELSAIRLPSALEFFPYDAPEGAFQGLPASTDKVSQGHIDQSLIVAPSSLVDFVPKPVQKVVVQPNCHSCFAWWDRHNCSTFALAEIVFLFHVFSRYCHNSFGVAVRAEMRRMMSPRHV